MKKLTALFLAVACTLGLGGCKWLYDSQYNKNGVSHFLVITIDENQPREYVGELENHRIYVEKLKMDDLYFTTVDAKNISLGEAVAKGLVSIDDWRKNAWKTVRNGETEILRYENYEIAISDGNCIIRPMTK